MNYNLFCCQLSLHLCAADCCKDTSTSKNAFQKCTSNCARSMQEVQTRLNFYMNKVQVMAFMIFAVSLQFAAVFDNVTYVVGCFQIISARGLLWIQVADLLHKLLSSQWKFLNNRKMLQYLWIFYCFRLLNFIFNVCFCRFLGQINSLYSGMSRQISRQPRFESFRKRINKT